MLDDESGIEVGISANNHFIVEYGQRESVTYEKDIPIRTLYCTIPVPENEPEIKVVVNLPELNTAVNTVLYIDGELLASRCKLTDVSTRLTLQSVRVSATEARSIKLKKIRYDQTEGEDKALSSESGEIRVDVWSGWKGDKSYEPIIRYGDHHPGPYHNEGLHQDVGKNVLKANAMNDAKGCFEITHRVDFGPVRLTADRRRHFDKEHLLARFIFLYRDRNYIQSQAMVKSRVIVEHKKIKARLKELVRQGPIDLGD